MVDITKDEVWDSDYEKESNENKHKMSGASKIIITSLILLAITLTTNIILIYSFFNLLNKV